MQPILEISALHVSVEGKHVLKGVSFVVNPGELVAIMGPNGSGKSTLAQTLAGHPRYQVTTSTAAQGTQNQLLLNGEDISALTPDERSRKGLFLAFQTPIEVPGLKVLQFLWAVYKQRFSEADRQFSKIIQFRDYCLTLVEKLQLPATVLERGLHEGFSGGERKRLEMLQLFVLQPKVAILDETDSGLDIDAIKVVAAAIAEAREKFGTAFLVITHYQRILEYIQPSRVIVIAHGEVVQEGDQQLITQLEKTGYQAFLNKGETASHSIQV